MPLYLQKNTTNNTAVGEPNCSTLFFHIPKTGGSSVDAWLESVYRGRPQFATVHGAAKTALTPQHYGYQYIHDNLDKTNIDSLFKFAIVRNPYHRLESEFFYRVKLKTINLGPNPKYMFSAWVCDMLNQANRTPDMLDNHFQCQQYYLNSDVKVYKFEDGLLDITKRVASRIGVIAPVSLPLKQVSKKAPVFWTNQAIAMVNAFYKPDFEQLGYSLMPFNTDEGKLTSLHANLQYKVLTFVRQKKHAWRHKTRT